MARRSAVTIQPASNSSAVSVYKVWYHFCPVILVEARDEADAADKYRARFNLHFLRQPKVELTNVGG